MQDIRITVRLPQKLVDALDDLAIGDGLSRPTRSTVVRDLLAEAIRAGQRRASR